MRGYKRKGTIGPPRNAGRTAPLTYREAKGNPASTPCTDDSFSLSRPSPPRVTPMDIQETVVHTEPSPVVNTIRLITTLPKGIRTLGNSKGWQMVLNHLKDYHTKHKPLVLWGPTGCGKTFGVRELLYAMKYRIVELDGSDGEDTNQLITWVKRVRDIKVLQGPTAILLDDYESFTEDARKRMATMLKNTKDTNLAPIIITCTQFKEPRLRDLHIFHNIRLFSPNEHVCKEWFDKNGFILQTNKSGSFQQVQCFPKHGWDSREQCHLVTGDLRRITIALQWKALTKHALFADGTNTPFLNSFQATQHLLLRKTNASRWAAGAEPRDADLIREHIPKYVNEDIDVLADVLDYLSASDVMTPSRFELSSTQIPFKMELVGQATHHFSKARDVGALYPPALPTPSWGHTRSIQSSEDRPKTMMELLELPKLLRDLE